MLLSAISNCALCVPDTLSKRRACAHAGHTERQQSAGNGQQDDRRHGELIGIFGGDFGRGQRDDKAERAGDAEHPAVAIPANIVAR